MNVSRTIAVYKVRKNFELLDEMLDYGYPQCMSTEGLKNYIHNEPVQVARVQSTKRLEVCRKPRPHSSCLQAHIHES